MTQPANGQVPTGALVNVQWGTFMGRLYAIALETATAAAFLKAQADGHLTICPDLGGMRTSAQQLDLHNNPRAHGSALHPSQIRASGSTHGWGTCVDISDGNAWFQAHCGDYGFVMESPAGENNHYRYLWPTWAVTPPAPAHDANTRTMKANGSNIRFAPSSKSASLGVLNAGDTFEVVGIYTSEGESINGSTVWYGLARGWVAASITVEGVKLDGLHNVASPMLPPVPVVPVSLPSASAPTGDPETPAAPTNTDAPSPVVPDPHRTPPSHVSIPTPPAVHPSKSPTAPWWVPLLSGLWAALFPGKK